MLFTSACGVRATAAATSAPPPVALRHHVPAAAVRRCSGPPATCPLSTASPRGVHHVASVARGDRLKASGPTAENKACGDDPRFQRLEAEETRVVPEDDLSGLLNECSLYLVGADHDLNRLVAEHLATTLEYTPMSTERLVERVTGKLPSEVSVEEGAEAQGAVLRQLSGMPKCCIVVYWAHPSGWEHMKRGISVCLAPATSASCPESTDQQLFGDADITVEMDGKPKEECFVNPRSGVLNIRGGSWTPLLITAIAQQVHRALLAFLEDNPRDAQVVCD